MSYVNTLNLRTDNPTGDAFGRLRVSSPSAVFDSKQLYADPDIEAGLENTPLFFDNQELSGSGTSTLYSAATASTRLSTGAAAGSRARQTRMRFNYQPGKSQLALLTFVMGSQLEPGISRRVGLFDQANGLFFEDNGTAYGFARRSSALGAAADDFVPQASWNMDRMDGTGPSGVSLRFDRTQILVIDYEWLGVGRVRMGWNVDGLTYYAHEFLNANNLAEVYMSTPNLPVRCEISNDGTGPIAHIDQICASVMSEGGQEALGSVRTVSTAGLHVDCTTEDVWYAIIGIRLKASYIAQAVNVLSVALQEQAGTKKIEWGLFFNPIVAGSLTFNGAPRSGIEYALGATANTVTGGFQIAGGFFQSGNNASGAAGSATSNVPNALRLGSLIDGTPDVIALCAKTIGGSSGADIEGLITYQELI